VAQIDLSALGGRQVAEERDRWAVRRFDLTLLVGVLGLAVYGILMVYSATRRGQAVLSVGADYFVRRQVLFAIVGVVAMVVASLIDYRLAKIWAGFVYAGFIVLLLLVRTPLGSSALGAQRWFPIFGFQFSPSLFTRLGLVLALAAYLANHQGALTLRRVIACVMLAGVSMFLVFVQPDIGTTIILATILVALLIAAGARARYLALLTLLALAAIFGAFRLGVMQDWQIQRLSGFLDQSKNTQTANYNLQQSEIAIGSGGLSGRGFLKGTQTNLAFVPEQQTDFIFTVVGEELGFVGAVALFLLYLLVLWRAYRIAVTAKDPFGTYLAVGIGAMFVIQIFVNVGMTMGIMPITGIPLPFLSYGGSALIADLAAVGILQSVYMRSRS
jgi:rod shape determining protein RodA